MVTELHKQIGAALREARKLQGLSLRDASAISGVDVPNLCNIENGRKGFSLHTFDRILKSYEMEATVVLSEL